MPEAVSFFSPLLLSTGCVLRPWAWENSFLGVGGGGGGCGAFEPNVRPDPSKGGVPKDVPIPSWFLLPPAPALSHEGLFPRPPFLYPRDNKPKQRQHPQACRAPPMGNTQ